MNYVSHVVKSDGIDITYEFGGNEKTEFVSFKKIGATEKLRFELHAKLIKLLPEEERKKFNSSN